MELLRIDTVDQQSEEVVPIFLGDNLFQRIPSSVSHFRFGIAGPRPQIIQERTGRSKSEPPPILSFH
ncbi:hypothetical protein D5S18_02120 [Nocardia panacis]|uniref:Uncharacterized protein n=1 Tax=Nocardia panacis TaxID=2340916 RepID=A0A3A4KBC9_9NOCA|nr:hypothetical protein D5S18_02120 [Nocardia panacis]